MQCQHHQLVDLFVTCRGSTNRVHEAKMRGARGGQSGTIGTYSADHVPYEHKAIR